jgi:ABC-2 type transport system ATP-binding protein
VVQHKGVIAEAVRRLDQAGVGIDDIALHRPTLDDVFLSLTGRPVEEENGSSEAAAPEEVTA